MKLLIILSSAILHISSAITCFNCESDFQGTLRCQQPCEGEQCVVWKWMSKSELSIKQGCLKGIDRQWTSKIGCRTNHLGASMCICEDGSLCNRVDRADQINQPLPQLRLPAVECQNKIQSTGFVGARRERVCTSNYCHVTNTETSIDTIEDGMETMRIANCGDIPEFDFDVRLKNSIGFPGLYSNGCYRIQVEMKVTIIDCICSRNKCNEVLAEIPKGHVRCYVGKDFYNTSQINKHDFCEGDFCIIQSTNGRVSKGCISVNERNSWSHLKIGHRKILGVEQWLCQAHLCNFDLERLMKSIESMNTSIRLNNSGIFPNFHSFIFIFFLFL